MEVRRQDGIKRFRMKRHSHSHRVDQHVIHRLCRIVNVRGSETPITSLRLDRATHDIGEILSDLVDYLVPEDHPVPHGVGLGHVREKLSRTSLRQLERIGGDTLDADTSENGDLCMHWQERLNDQYRRIRKRQWTKLTGTDLVRKTAVRSAAVPSVFALGILSNDTPVEIFRLAVSEGRLRARKDTGPTVVLYRQ
jgi:hypothetical protein